MWYSDCLFCVWHCSLAGYRSILCQHPLIASPKMSAFNAIVVPELELSDVQRQIFVADLVEAAHDAALDERPETFDRVRVDCANDMLAFGVVNGFVREPMLQSIIAVIGVCAKEANAGRDGFANEAFRGRAVSAVDDAGDDVPLAPDCADDSGFEGVAEPPVFPLFLSQCRFLSLPPT